MFHILFILILILAAFVGLVGLVAVTQSGYKATWITLGILFIPAVVLPGGFIVWPILACCMLLACSKAVNVAKAEAIVVAEYKVAQAKRDAERERASQEIEGETRALKIAEAARTKVNYDLWKAKNDAARERSLQELEGQIQATEMTAPIREAEVARRLVQRSIESEHPALSPEYVAQVYEALERRYPLSQRAWQELHGQAQAYEVLAAAQRAQRKQEYRDKVAQEAATRAAFRARGEVWKDDPLNSPDAWPSDDVLFRTRRTTSHD